MFFAQAKKLPSTYIVNFFLERVEPLNFLEENVAIFHNFETGGQPTAAKEKGITLPDAVATLTAQKFNRSTPLDTGGASHYD